MRSVTGRKLNKLWNINARHCLYNKEGKKYHKLRRFPAALCDKHGYIYFHNLVDYVVEVSNGTISETEKSIYVPNGGISEMRHYVNMEEQGPSFSLWAKIKQVFGFWS